MKNQEKEELLIRKGKARRYAKDYHLSISGKSSKKPSIVKLMIHEYERKLNPEVSTPKVVAEKPDESLP